MLILGIGGGVSLAGLQLAHAIDGVGGDVAKAVLALTNGRGVDVVLEDVGAAAWPHASKSLVRGGWIVTCGAAGDQPGADLAAFVGRHALQPAIDSTHALDHVTAALIRLESGRPFGKVALRMAG